MNILRLMLILVVTSVHLYAQTPVKSNTKEKFGSVGGLVLDCDDKINMYLALTGSTKSKNIDLSKYPRWDLSEQFLVKDWNAKGQGFQGSCTSFAVANCISIQRNIDNWLLKKNRTLIQYSPSFIFNVAKSKYRDPFKSACEEGISYIDAYLVVRDLGIPSLLSCPYEPSGIGCRVAYYPKVKAYKEALNMKIGNFQRPFRKVDIFKTLLVDTPFNAICIGVYLTSAYEEATSNKTGKWIKPGIGDGKTAHAMLIVGFDNDKQAFKVLDWQGKDSGDKGVIWMDYKLIENPAVVFDAYIVSHGTEYLDPKTGSRTGAPDVDRNGGFSFWIKSGYQTVKDKLIVSCKYVNKDTKKAVFKVSDFGTGELIKDDIYLNAGGGNRCFSFGADTYKLTLVEIAKRGSQLNIVNRFASVMKLEKIDASQCNN